MMNTTRQLTRTIVFLLTLSFVTTLPAQEKSGNSETELLALLRSDAPKREKAIACKKLAIHGSSAAVPELAKLLPDPQLSSWARIALEAIPGSASDDALRKAAESLEGKLLVGTINSIGVRKDAAAVKSLTKRLADADEQVASAAAVALGKIGDAEATKSLREALAKARPKVRSAIAEGCILCAEQRLAARKSPEATAIYDQVRKAEVPKQRIIEATRGAILARNFSRHLVDSVDPGNEDIALLLELFRSSDKAMFQLGLSTAREFPDDRVDEAMAAEIAKAPAARAALIIQTMADRPKTVDLSAVRKAAAQGNKRVRLSAINALQRVGDDSCLATLLESATEDDAELAATAKETLAKLPGKNVNKQIVGLLSADNAKQYPLLLELVGQRRIDAVPAVLKAVDHRDSSVRSAALIALGETVSLSKLSVLITQAVTPRHSEDAEVARKALKAASVRMPDRDACATELASALNQAPSDTKNALLEIIAEVGGEKALQTVATAAKSDDSQLQDTGSRLLGKWNSVDAAPVLLDLAKNAPAQKYKIRALRGYIGLARKFAMPEKRRAQMCQNAFDAASRIQEMRLVLDVAKLHPSVEALAVVTQIGKVADLKTDATAATLVIVQKLSRKGIDVSKLVSGTALQKVKLEIIKAEYGAGSTQKDVTKIVQKRAGQLPLITLSSSSYNASFGGDPVPGVVKKLKIKYRINGKAAEATFGENALIILPIPK